MNYVAADVKKLRDETGATFADCENCTDRNRRIEVVVVDAAIDHVDALQAFGRAHEYHVVVDEQIVALHQFDAELVGEKGMFEIGGIVARRAVSRTTVGIGDAAMGATISAFREVVRDSDRPVLCGVARTVRGKGAASSCGSRACRRRRKGCAQLSSRTWKFAGVVAHDVDAGDVDIDVVRALLAVHLGAENRSSEAPDPRGRLPALRISRRP